MSVQSKNNFGCDHYRRRCKLEAPCCGKVYPCRVCHDMSEDHEIDRKSVTNIVCSVCDTVQKVGEHCRECQVLFGRYFCKQCRLYDYEDKGQFHCDGCGICRAGGKDNFFHCEGCGCCLTLSLKNNHKCLQNASKRNCPACDVYMHSSREELAVLQCSHMVHRQCWDKIQSEYGYVACPSCTNKSNMSILKAGVIPCQECHELFECSEAESNLCPKCRLDKEGWSGVEADTASLSLFGGACGFSYIHGEVEGSLKYESNGEVDGSKRNGLRRL